MHAPDTDRAQALLKALPDLIRLPPLGQDGRRRRYAPLLRALCEIFRADSATVGIWTAPHHVQRFRLRRTEGTEDVYEDACDPGHVDGPVGRVLRDGTTIVLEKGDNATAQPDGGDYPGHDSVSCLLAALRVRDEPPALVTLHRFSGDSFVEEDRLLAQSLGPLLGTALDNLRRFTRAEELSITDELTGVYNYRYLRSALDKEVSRARRFGETFSLIMLDVDHLKEYNDVHGHLKGSEVLRRLAAIVMEKLREADVVAKYGGDEFVIIVPQTDRQGAWILADRIREAIDESEFPGESQKIRITSSLGISEFPTDGLVARDLLDAADAALYCAKRGGRNRVAVGGNSVAGTAGSGRPDSDT